MSHLWQNIKEMIKNLFKSFSFINICEDKMKVKYNNKLQLLSYKKVTIGKLMNRYKLGYLEKKKNQ